MPILGLGSDSLDKKFLLEVTLNSIHKLLLNAFTNELSFYYKKIDGRQHLVTLLEVSGVLASKKLF